MKTIKELLNNKFLKNTLLISGGTAFAQILNITIMPILSRLFSPADYGVMNVFMSIVIVLCLLGSLNYEMGVPIAETNRKAINVFVLSIVILLIFTSLSLILVLTFGEIMVGIFNLNEINKYLILIPISTFLIGVYNIFLQYAFREKNFISITKTKFSQSIVQNLTSMGFGFFGIGAIGLIIGRILGQSAGSSTLLTPILKKNRKLFKLINLTEIKDMFYRYKYFAILTTPRRFLGNLTIAAPVFILTYLYGSQVVGLFAFANSVIQVPMNLIGNSIRNVFYAESASLRFENPERIQKLSRKLFFNLTILGIIPALVLSVLGPQLFSMIFGSDWREAGVYASLLTFAAFSGLILKPISGIFDVYEKQGVALVWNILRIFLIVIAFSLSHFLSLGPKWAIGLYSLAIIITNIIEYKSAISILKLHASYIQ
ncbi:lipopolysaccharide biosynthesis protein [Halobacillus litoralis]|uniref:lipopolysaccharide biosynthesis protein n=1 Tax=Halobacillus litoralis TaxID=45668 RepID=UPI00136C1EBB|nr:oligosaccharide flippase family protein [Halobacillus litoralis]